ncbi:hypothetical protein CTAYLR_002569 [Chrysophaeum taylorii]|uniref:EF-hand domain-containing protein n=1 Tax=Chrysophaeum taylorii TaxID=2483200 RepID=A0AAD7UGK5_9STRA|nr:hypothetical protein CTAYLR_002569 [Chrysophaeum taylorii]
MERDNHKLAQALGFDESDPRLQSIGRVFHPGEVPELKEAFNAIDRDESGSISVDELTILFRELSDESVNRLMRAMDSDGSGDVDFSEFIFFASQVILEKTAERKNGSSGDASRDLFYRALFKLFMVRQLPQQFVSWNSCLALLMYSPAGVAVSAAVATCGDFELESLRQRVYVPVPFMSMWPHVCYVLVSWLPCAALYFYRDAYATAVVEWAAPPALFAILNIRVALISGYQQGFGALERDHHRLPFVHNTDEGQIFEAIDSVATALAEANYSAPLRTFCRGAVALAVITPLLFLIQTQQEAKMVFDGRWVYSLGAALTAGNLVGRILYLSSDVLLAEAVRAARLQVFSHASNPATYHQMRHDAKKLLADNLQAFPRFLNLRRAPDITAWARTRGLLLQSSGSMRMKRRELHLLVVVLANIAFSFASVYAMIVGLGAEDAVILALYAAIFFVVISLTLTLIRQTYCLLEQHVKLLHTEWYHLKMLKHSRRRGTTTRYHDPYSSSEDSLLGGIAIVDHPTPSTRVGALLRSWSSASTHKGRTTLEHEFDEAGDAPRDGAEDDEKCLDLLQSMITYVESCAEYPTILGFEVSEAFISTVLALAASGAASIVSMAWDAFFHSGR